MGCRAQGGARIGLAWSCRRPDGHLALPEWPVLAHRGPAPPPAAGMGALALQAHQLGSGNALRIASQRGRHAARGAVAAPPVCLSPEQMAAALQRQLVDSAQAAAADAQRRAARAATPADEPGSAIPPRKPSRRLLREQARAAAVAAAAAAAAQSEELQAAIGRRAGPLNGAALACALAVQLRQSDTFDEVGGQHASTCLFACP